MNIWRHRFVTSRNYHQPNPMTPTNACHDNLRILTSPVTLHSICFFRFQEGMAVMGVLEALRLPEMRSVLLFNSKPSISSKEMKSLFDTKHTATEGSSRYKEEAQRRAWFNELLDVIEKGENLSYRFTSEASKLSICFGHSSQTENQQRVQKVCPIHLFFSCILAQ